MILVSWQQLAEIKEKIDKLYENWDNNVWIVDHKLGREVYFFEEDARAVAKDILPEHEPKVTKERVL